MPDASERRQKILTVISVRRQDLMTNLASEFCVSLSTIQRDVMWLGIMHNPVYTKQGKGGGVYMIEGCYAGSKYFTTEEKLLLIKTLKFLTEEEKTLMLGIIRAFSLPGSFTKEN